MFNLIFPIPDREADLTFRFASHRTLFGRNTLHGALGLFDDVGARGDEAIREATRTFDGVDLERLVLSDGYIERCVTGLSPALRQAIDRAVRNVGEANRELLPSSWEIGRAHV